MLQQCRLCSEYKILINSHIVPEGFYKKIYDDKRRVYFSSESRGTFITMQKGQREKLLCKECDSDVIGNKYDKYGIEVIRDDLHKETYVDKEKIIWTGLDYNRLKIFLLSVLWRAHIAQNFHGGITLDESTAAIIVESIKSGQAPAESVIPIVGVVLMDPDDDNLRCDEFITNGRVYKRPGLIHSMAYIIMFGGYAWTFIVPKSEENDRHKGFFLKEHGSMILVKVNIHDFRPFTDLMENIEFANDNFDRLDRSTK
ncbi:hypothetical protein NST38_31340 [Paenibacillus sp. FSL H8-0104]|uniref:hypothetical protein n=1 Tax=Paenibacillus sp. FSL H8-0104 TaxID=2954509 RepID=UPI0030FDB34B